MSPPKFNVFPLVLNVAPPQHYISPVEFTANWTRKQIAAERIKIAETIQLLNDPFFRVLI